MGLKAIRCWCMIIDESCNCDFCCLPPICRPQFWTVSIISRFSAHKSHTLWCNSMRDCVCACAVRCGGNTETRSKLTPTEWDSLSSLCFRLPRQSIPRHQQQINQNVRAENDIMLISQFEQKTLFMLHEKPVYVNSFHHRTFRGGFPSFSCKIEREKLRWNDFSLEV